jgi:hypothetical protein
MLHQGILEIYIMMGVERKQTEKDVVVNVRGMCKIHPEVVVTSHPFCMATEKKDWKEEI